MMYQLTTPYLLCNDKGRCVLIWISAVVRVTATVMVVQTLSGPDTDFNPMAATNESDDSN